MSPPPFSTLGLVPLVLLRWRIGVLSLGDDEARALGVNVRLVRGVVIVAATLVTYLEFLRTNMARGEYCALLPPVKVRVGGCSLGAEGSPQ